MADRAGFYFTYRDNNAERNFRQSDGLRKHARYFGPFENETECKFFSSWHRNVAGQFAPTEQYNEHNIAIIEELPEETIEAASVKFWHQRHADYQRELGYTYGQIRKMWNERVENNDFSF